MIGLGTLINMGAIVAGGAAGLVCRRTLRAAYQKNLIAAMGLACLFLGISGSLSQMLTVDGAGPALASRGALMSVVSLALGTVAGTWLDIEGLLVRAGRWLKEKAGGAGDDGFVNAFVTASVTVAIGAMAVVGSIQDGLSGDYTTLAVKGIADCVIIMAMTAAMGKGCVFSAIPVGILQGLMTFFAWFLGPFLTGEAVSCIGLTGSMLIFAVGVNLVWGPKFSVANMLPTVLFAAAWPYFF